MTFKKLSLNPVHNASWPSWTSQQSYITILRMASPPIQPKSAWPSTMIAGSRQWRSSSISEDPRLHICRLWPNWRARDKKKWPNGTSRASLRCAADGGVGNDQIGPRTPLPCSSVHPPTAYNADFKSRQQFFVILSFYSFRSHRSVISLLVLQFSVETVLGGEWFVKQSQFCKMPVGVNIYKKNPAGVYIYKPPLVFTFINEHL